MHRRTFLLNSASLIITGCNSATGTGVDAISSRKPHLGGATYPVAIILGAALGFAVASYTGGSPIVGIAFGAFAGVAAGAAVEYSRYILKESRSELVPSYRSLTSAVVEDYENFQMENIPILAEKQRIIREAGLDRLDNRSRNVAETLNRLNHGEAQLKKTPLPNSIYVKSVPIYRDTSSLLPRISKKPFTTEAKMEKRNADIQIIEKGRVIMATNVNNLAADKLLMLHGLA